MNNITYPEGFGQPEKKWSEIRWHPIIYGEPKIRDVYLVTIHVDGVKDIVMCSDWDGERWDTEVIGECVAYALFPQPYFKGN